LRALALHLETLLQSLYMRVISGSDFCTAIENTARHISLVNSDKYPKSQWEFIDRESATECYGATAALSIFIAVDSNRSWKILAPIVADSDGNTFADGSQTITVFPDDVKLISFQQYNKL
jgi:hypothetical protein